MLRYRALFVIFYFVIISAIITYIETSYFLISIKVLYLILSIKPMYLIAYMFGAIFFIHKNNDNATENIRYKELSEISSIWLRKSVEVEILPIESAPIKIEVVEEKIEIIETFETTIVQLFVAEVVEKNRNKIKKEELVVIYKLLKLLELNKTASSVASLYEYDPETIKLKEQTQPDVKNNYTLLSKVTLIAHTLRVARIAYKHMTKIQTPLIGKILIVTLSHDIGKIGIKNNDIIDDKQLLRKNPHEQISVLMFREMFADFSSLKTVTDAIKTHHIGATDSVIAKILKEADLKAREEEIMLINSESCEIEAHEPLEKQSNQPTESTELHKTEVLLDEQNMNVVSQKDNIKILDYKDHLLPILNAAINTAEKSSIGVKITSVSYKKTILFDYIFIKKTFEMTLKKRLDQKMFLEIIKDLVSQNIVQYIDVQKGLFVSTYHIKSSFFEFDAKFIPISIDFFGVTEAEVELSKRNNAVLRNIVVTTYSKKIEQGQIK